jgi:uroporphyrinogen III methyltransferase/synthase
VALVTGHEDPDKDEAAIDWPALAAFPGTLVFYMGVGRLPQIASSLIAAGRPGSEPAAVVENGTLPAQRTVSATLQTIAETVRDHDVRPPSITVVGPVAALAGELSWLPARPLAGRTVAVTRARAQASELARRLQEHGARVVQAPVIRVEPLPGPPLDPSAYDLICVTSANGVAALFERLEAGGRDARALAQARIAAVGNGTARALAEHGIRADILPERSVAESLVEALSDVPATRALVARGRDAREVLPDALRARGIEVDVLALYETIAEPLSERALELARSADYITFTSASTVRFFMEAVGGDRHADAPLSPATRVVSIGPVTSQTLREHGVQVDLEAERHDIDGLLDVLLADAASRAGEPAVP